jgi:hypothetical protein
MFSAFTSTETGTSFAAVYHVLGAALSFPQTGQRKWTRLDRYHYGKKPNELKNCGSELTDVPGAAIQHRSLVMKKIIMALLVVGGFLVTVNTAEADRYRGRYYGGYRGGYGAGYWGRSYYRPYYYNNYYRGGYYRPYGYYGSRYYGNYYYPSYGYYYGGYYPYNNFSYWGPGVGVTVGW